MKIEYKSETFNIRTVDYVEYIITTGILWGITTFISLAIFNSNSNIGLIILILATLDAIISFKIHSGSLQVQIVDNERLFFKWISKPLLRKNEIIEIEIDKLIKVKTHEDQMIRNSDYLVCQFIEAKKNHSFCVRKSITKNNIDLARFYSELHKCISLNNKEKSHKIKVQIDYFSIKQFSKKGIF